ncbi:MAG: AlpA family phage regulatory protein [Aquabacterium sp.]|uniref:AlpA family phage regulatory protein n=1 Tax=Aquabacterium sp. TaxID=1872578 RepID=UPI0025C5531A|nr:AlpA family phage regulatory protein [Aquabacterium sp.]MBI5925870.1 AlpA family phage regulatory protein [Aquabacterium sp.]
MVRLKEVIQMTGLSRSMIYLKSDKKSPYWDPSFPERRKISERAVAWLHSQIIEWMKMKFKQTNSQD